MVTFWVGNCGGGGVSRIEEYRLVLVQYIHRLLIPYVVWGILYFWLGSIIDAISDGVELTQSLLSHIHAWIVSSPGGGLWYVQAIIAICLLLLISNSKKYFASISLALGVFYFSVPVIDYFQPRNAAVGYLVGLYDSIFIDKLNFAFQGFIFVLGIFLATSSGVVLLNRLNGKTFSALFITYLLADVFLADYMRVAAKAIFLLCAVNIFAILLSVHSKCGAQKNVHMRKASSIIYFSHFLFIYAIKVLFLVLKLDFYRHSTLGWLICAVTLTLWAVLILRNSKLLDRVHKLF